MQKKLLPNGFYDSIDLEERNRIELIYALSNNFQSFGYIAVSMPLLEFEDSLFSGPGKLLEDETFRMMDPVSTRMLGLRADLTPQSVRISNRLERPLRICYFGDVCRVKGKDVEKRQLTQSGIEIFGVDGLKAYLEILKINIISLNKVDCNDITIDFVIPEIAKRIINSLNLKDNDDLKNALDNKDIASLKKISSSDKLIELIEIGNFDFGKLKKLDLDDVSSQLINDLIEIVSYLRDNFKNIEVTFDLVESRGFSYHNGIAFTIFSNKTNKAIAKGGRYFINDDESAIGSTFYIDNLVEITNFKDDRKRIIIPDDLEEIKILQLQKSYITIFSAKDKLKENADALGVDLIFGVNCE